MGSNRSMVPVLQVRMLLYAHGNRLRACPDGEVLCTGKGDQKRSIVPVLAFESTKILVHTVQSSNNTLYSRELVVHLSRTRPTVPVRTVL